VSKYAYSQNNFISGELSPKLRGRNDVQQYFSGLATMENFIPFRSGGAGSRPGTIFGVDLGAVPGLSPKLITYSYDNKDFLITISLNTVEVREVTNAFPTWKFNFTSRTVNLNANFLDQYPSNLLNPNQFVVAGNFIFVTDKVGPPFVITYNPTDNTFDVDTYWQKALLLNQANTAAKSVIRATPFPARNQSQNLTMTPNAGRNQLTASADVFTSNMEGSYIRVKENGVNQEEFYIINTVSSPTVAQVTQLISGPLSTSAQREWAISSWYNGNWPTTVGLYQNRLIFGGNFYQPDTIWVSNTNNPFIMMTYKSAKDTSSNSSGLNYFGGVLDSDAFDVVLGSGEVDRIRWITSDRSLQVGTDTVENFILPVDGIFGPKNFNIVPSTFFGGSNTQALRYQNSTYFIERDSKNIRELSFSEENGSNVSRLLTALSDELHRYRAENISVEPRFEKIASWRSRSTILLTNTSQDGLIGITVDKSTQILAFHKHYFTGGKIKDMGSLKTSLNPEVLFLLVERDGNIYIEYMVDFFNKDNIPENMDLSGDSYHTLDSSANPLANPVFNEITIPHLADGTEIDVFVKGEYDGRKTIASSKVTITDDTATADQIYYGIPITKTLETMPIEAGSRIGNSQIQLNRIHEVMLRLYRSRGGKCGKSTDSLDDVKYPALGASELYTGDIEICFDSCADTQQKVVIQSDEPYPINILSIGMEGSTED
jgi:hypothetical protein